MNIKSFFLLLYMVISHTFAHSQIDRVEPPNWWCGMKNHLLQLMIYGNKISNTNVSLNYNGVILISTEKTENSNYLFVNLEITEHARPGTMNIEFRNGNELIATVPYELRHRNSGSDERRGFNNSDVIYLLMPDRFANGNPENDSIPGMRETKVDRNDKTGRHGGDLEGIINHLDYIQDMGFTAIWLNPFLENNMVRSSYHGYSTTDYYKTDPRFGTNEDVITLSEAAAERGIKLIMDMIFNHIGSYHWWMDDLPASDWINNYPDYKISNHRRTVNQDPYASEYDRKGMVDGWFVKSMPDLNQRNPFLANYLIQNSIWWIEYAGLAGIRMDTYPYNDKMMMAEWNRRVLEEFPYFNIVGEEWTPNPAVVSYWQKGQNNRDGYDGEIPSMMDFPLQMTLVESLQEKEDYNTGWIKLYEMLANDHLYPDPFNLVIFPDNHDMSRFFMQLEMNQKLYKLGITYILTTRGIPQIFYGSEILMTHKEGDHHGYIRKDFPGGWDGDEKNAFTGEGMSKDELEMQQFFRTLMKWRKENPVIHTGKLIHFAPEKGVYVYGRYNNSKKVMVILNKNKKKVTLDSNRFEELLGMSEKGTDVITGKIHKINKKITVSGETGLVIELE